MLMGEYHIATAPDGEKQRIQTMTYAAFLVSQLCQSGKGRFLVRFEKNPEKEYETWLKKIDEFKMDHHPVRDPETGTMVGVAIFMKPSTGKSEQGPTLRRRLKPRSVLPEAPLEQGPSAVHTPVVSKGWELFRSGVLVGALFIGVALAIPLGVSLSNNKELRGVIKETFQRYITLQNITIPDAPSIDYGRPL